MAADRRDLPRQDRIGRAGAGDRLPSIASLAQEFEIAKTTAQKVIEALRREGLVDTSPMGTYVRQRAE